MLKYKSPSEQIAICEAWKQSGLTKIKFCRQNNFSRSTFYKWCKQFQNTNNKASITNSNTTIKTDPIKFLKVCHAIPSKSLALDSNLLEISLANGINLKVTISNVDNFLLELLKWK